MTDFTAFSGGNRKDHAPMQNRKHDPEKWIPVFRKDHAQMKDSMRQLKKKLRCAEH
jgi:hypothetical protein